MNPILSLSLLMMLMTGLKANSEPSVHSACFETNIIQQDLSELYTKLQASHYDLFVNVTSTDYDHWFKQIKSQIKDCMEINEVTVLFQKFMAFGKIAHARIDLPNQLYAEYLAKDGLFFPLSVKSDGISMWISQNFSANQSVKTGDVITAINGIPTKTLLARLNQYLSTDTKIMFGGFLEFYLDMLLWLELGEVKEFDLMLRQKNNERSVTVKAINQNNQKQKAKELNASLKLDWSRIAEIKANNIAYLRPGPFFNTEGKPDEVWDYSLFSTFIDESFKQFAQSQPKALLIDIRDNPGGDNSFSDLMIERIANKPFKFASTFNVKVSQAFKDSNDERFETLTPEQQKGNLTSVQFKNAYDKLSNGEKFDFQLPLNQPYKHVFKAPVFILINRHSYSNAVTVAAMAQDYGFAKIMGEETTDLATTYGAMEHFYLSNTGLKIGFPKAFIVRPNGDKTVRGVVPDIKIETPIFENSNDPVLKIALNKIKQLL